MNLRTHYIPITYIIPAKLRLEMYMRTRKTAHLYACPRYRSIVSETPLVHLSLLLANGTVKERHAKLEQRMEITCGLCAHLWCADNVCGLTARVYCVYQ